VVSITSNQSFTFAAHCAPSALATAAEHPRLSIEHIGQRVAGSDCALLITGETGTGKGYLASMIHNRSRRSSAAFVPVNCGAIPETLIDSHLFGHARGSFSGANSDHLGLVRAAQGGTLLLDEISELPMTAQVRLLRLLEEREVQPVGYSKPVVVNVRIIASTNGDLAAAVAKGTFRSDLYYRLDVVRLHLRPLRERTEEIPELLERFNREFAELYRRPELILDRAAIRLFMDYHWPGNVRELRTVVERLHVMCVSDHVGVEELKQYGQLRMAAPQVSVGPASIRMQEFRLEAVNQVLSACRGNMSRAATMLGVHRSTLYRWIQSNASVEAVAV
jgi:DNA-binding NtrC family response regulator